MLEIKSVPPILKNLNFWCLYIVVCTLASGCFSEPIANEKRIASAQTQDEAILLVTPRSDSTSVIQSLDDKGNSSEVNSADEKKKGGARHIDVKNFPMEAEVLSVISGTEIMVKPLNIDSEIKIYYLGVTTEEGLFSVVQSLEFNEFLTKNRIVNISEKDLYFDADEGAYGAYVFCDGEFINKVILASGFGQFDGINSEISRKEELLAAQESAMRRGLGLWEGFIKGNQNTCGTLPCAKR